MGELSPAVADPRLAALIERARAADRAAEEARSAVLAYVAGDVPPLVLQPAAADEWPTFADDPDLIAVSAAAKRTGQSPGTIRRWCRDDGIGRKYGKDWLVSARRLKARLDP